MTFKCEVCGKSNTTEAGLALHMKVFHKEQKAPEKKPSKPKKAPKKPAASKPKEKELSLDKVTKKKLEAYNDTKKKFKQKPTGVKHNTTVKKAELKKIFPSGMRSRLLRESQEVEVHSLLEASYTAIVLTNNKGWSRVRLTGNATRISWAEGPMPKGKYKVTYPNLCKR